MPGHRLSAADFERAKSWLPEIAEALLPAGTRWQDEGSRRRYLGQGGLFIDLRSGAWWSFAKRTPPIAMIKCLKGSGMNAIEYLTAFLFTRQGFGSCGTDSADDDDGPASKAEAENVRDNLIADVIGTPVEAYLRSRGIEPPYPACVGYLPHTRPGEYGLVGVLTWNGRVAGYQVSCLTPDGAKSLVTPVRRRFNLEKAPGAVFEISVRAPMADILIGTGLEDALSLAKLGRSERVIGIPGDGALQNLTFARGTHVIVCRDGDEKESPADQAIVAGLCAFRSIVITDSVRT